MKEKSTRESMPRRCAYCNAKEDEVRLIGNFIVELKQVEVKNVNKLVCQSCRIKIKEVREAISKDIGF